MGHQLITFKIRASNISIFFFHNMEGMFFYSAKRKPVLLGVGNVVGDSNGCFYNQT